LKPIEHFAKSSRHGGHVGVAPIVREKVQLSAPCVQYEDGLILRAKEGNCKERQFDFRRVSSILSGFYVSGQQLADPRFAWKIFRPPNASGFEGGSHDSFTHGKSATYLSLPIEPIATNVTANLLEIYLALAIDHPMHRHSHTLDLVVST
jgi:hypothetical protein